MALPTTSSHPQNWGGAGEAVKGPLQPHPSERMDCGYHHPQHAGVSAAVPALVLGYKIKLWKFQPEAGRGIFLSFAFLFSPQCFAGLFK